MTDKQYVTQAPVVACSCEGCVFDDDGDCSKPNELGPCYDVSLDVIYVEALTVNDDDR